MLNTKQKIILDNHYLLEGNVLSLEAANSNIDEKFNEDVISLNNINAHSVYEYFSRSNEPVLLTVEKEKVGNIKILGINKDGFNFDCIHKLNKNGICNEKYLTTDFASEFLPSVFSYAIYINKTDKRDIMLKRLKVAISLLKDIEHYISLDEVMKTDWVIECGKGAIYEMYTLISNETNGDKLMIDLSGTSGKIKSYVYHKND